MPKSTGKPKPKPRAKPKPKPKKRTTKGKKATKTASRAKATTTKTAKRRTGAAKARAKAPPVEEPALRVFLLDDHEVVRAGIAELINAQSDLEVVGSHGHVDGALEAAVACHPDVAVLDVRLGDGNGVEVCRDLRSGHPEIACLMLTSFADDRAVVDASVAGASGFVLKEIQSNDLIDSIRKVAAGSQLLDAAEVRMALDRLRNSVEGRVDSLTEQEHRIFDLIGEGYSNRQIAKELYLAEKTVKNYVSYLLAKLGMERRTEAAATAARLDERQRMRRQ